MRLQCRRENQSLLFISLSHRPGQTGLCRSGTSQASVRSDLRGTEHSLLVNDHAGYGIRTETFLIIILGNCNFLKIILIPTLS